MNKETIKNAVSLFLHCQKLVLKPKRLRFSDLECFLNPVLNEAEFNSILKSIFNLADHYFLIEKYKHPTALLVDINKLADRLKPNLNPNQKLILLTILLKFMKVNDQQENTHLNRALYCVAEIFSFNQKQTDALKILFSQDEPSKEDYSNSILLTKEVPDYKKMIDGLKVMQDNNYPFKLWIKNIKSVNHLLFKFSFVDPQHSDLGFQAGDICPYNSNIQNLLQKYGITLQTLSLRILSVENTLTTIEIPATERSPRISLNGKENKIELEGVSMISSPLHHFDPVFYWIEKFIALKREKISIHFNFSFFNTYTSKIILKILQKLVECESTGIISEFYWYYEKDDEELKEAGEHYASIVNHEFVFIPTLPVNLISA